MTRWDLPKIKMRSAVNLIAILILGALAAGCEGSSGGAPGLGSVSAPASPAASREIDAQFVGLSSSEPTNPSTYQIGPSDVLGIAVFQVPELNMDAQVGSNGTIMLPLIGVINVRGKEPQKVADDISAKLRAKYLQSPQVTVFVKSYNSQKVVVSGEVKNPGTIALTGDTTLLSAIADARGLTDLADNKNVLVFRRVDGKKYAARFNVTDIQAGKAPDPHLVKGDVVYVDTYELKYWVKSLLPFVSVAGLFVALV